MEAASKRKRTTSAGQLSTRLLPYVPAARHNYGRPKFITPDSSIVKATRKAARKYPSNNAIVMSKHYIKPA